MTIHDPRARQALYTSASPKTKGVPRGVWRIAIILGPIAVALVLFWTFL